MWALPKCGRLHFKISFSMTHTHTLTQAFIVLCCQSIQGRIELHFFHFIFVHFFSLAWKTIFTLHSYIFSAECSVESACSSISIDCVKPSSSVHRTAHVYISIWHRITSLYSCSVLYIVDYLCVCASMNWPYLTTLREFSFVSRLFCACQLKFIYMFSFVTVY